MYNMIKVYFYIKIFIDKNDIFILNFRIIKNYDKNEKIKRLLLV